MINSLQLRARVQHTFETWAQPEYDIGFSIVESHPYHNLEGRSMLTEIYCQITNPKLLTDYVMQHQIYFNNLKKASLNDDEFETILRSILRNSATFQVPTNNDGIEYDYESLDWSII